MRLALFVIIALLALAGLTVAGLAATGHLALPWQQHVVAKAPPPEGTVAVPLSVRAIAAYRAVSREDLLDPDTAKPVTKYLRVTPGPNAPLTRTGDILGRVLRHPKGAGYAFTEGDFYPRGTIAGTAAGVPVGKRAVTLDAAQIAGVRDLAAGDHVDLIGTVTADLTKVHLPAGPPPDALAQKVVDVQTLAADAVIVAPLTVRQVPYMAGATLNTAAQMKTKPVEEFTVAVDPGEVSAVQRAAALGASLSCVLHSSQPAPAGAETRPAHAANPSDSDRRFAVVETIVGAKHTYKYVGTASGGRP